MPAPNSVPCSVVDCDYTTPAGCPTWDLLRDFLQQHKESVHPTAMGQHVGHNAKLESLPRPQFLLNMTESKWQFVNMQWDAYIDQTPASDEQKVQQLRAACDKDLLQRLYDCGSFASLTTVQLLLDKMKELAVINVHKTIHMVHLWKMAQETTESIRAFAARITGKSDLCELSVMCTKVGCNTKVTYRDEVVLQVLLQGMRDQDIRARTLIQTAAGKLSKLSQVVEYIAAEETGIMQSKDICHETIDVSGVRKSAYKKEGQSRTPLHKCGYCGLPPHGKNSAKEREKSCTAWNNKCSTCQKLNHLPTVCRSKPATSATTTESEVTAVNSAVTGFVSSIKAALPTSSKSLQTHVDHLRQTTAGSVTTVPLSHHVHSAAAGWQSLKPGAAPTMDLRVTIDRPAYGSLALAPPRLKQKRNPGRVSGQKSVLDTGAQFTVVPIQLLHSLGIHEDTIFPIATKISAVNTASVDIVGGILLKFTATNPKTGIVRESRQLSYVSKTVPAIYLSKEACIDFGTIPANFPQIGGCSELENVASVNIDETNDTAAHCGLTL